LNVALSAALFIHSTFPVLSWASKVTNAGHKWNETKQLWSVRPWKTEDFKI